MPELPEVETMVRGIRPHLLGRTLQQVRRVPCTRKPLLVTPEPSRLSRRLAGQSVTEVRRFAKRIVIELEAGGCFAIEPRMTGLMLLSDPPSREHLRLEWRFRPEPDRADSLWFWDRRGLGTVRYHEPGELDRFLADRFGPDALSMTPIDWAARLSRTARPVKVALLDQSLVAGIGNLYASELLHRAGVHPARPCRSLTPAETARIAAAASETLHEAILHEGSTLSDGTYRNALNRAGGYQNRHRVYARAGLPCPGCGEPIRRAVHAGRSTFWCEACQPLGESI